MKYKFAQVQLKQATAKKTLIEMISSICFPTLHITNDQIQLDTDSMNI
jgi:hypothetical protein